ncbi:MAG: lipocalin family protein [Cytophagales bacterium]|nr:lipocalin family protein [Cytophagales bacterium]
MTNNIKTACLFIVSVFFSMHGVYAQKIDKNDLFNTWHLDKYADEEDYYKVPKIEQGDYINLKEDMTFELKTEGEIGKGTWMLNTNGTYIEMKHDDGVLEKMYIVHATPRTLVLMYDVDEYREFEAHYVSCK